jgi:small subunit ribosomal protein S16
MLSIRLSRVGKKKQPIYRVVVQDKQRDPWGKSVEIIGHYNPRANPKEIVLKEERVKHWLSVGAQPSATVHNLLVNAKLIEGSKVRATTKDVKPPKPTEEKKEEAPAAAEKDEAPAPEEKPAEEAKEEAPAEEKPAEEEKKEE